MKLRELTVGLAYAFLLATSPEAHSTVVLDEDFSDVGDWDDLGEAVSWDGHAVSLSAFDVVSGAVQLERSGPEARSATPTS